MISSLTHKAILYNNNIAFEIHRTSDFEYLLAGGVDGQHTPLDVHWVLVGQPVPPGHAAVGCAPPEHP